MLAMPQKLLRYWIEGASVAVSFDVFFPKQQLSPGMETLTTKKKRTTTTPNSIFPGESSPPLKFSLYIRNTILFRYNFVHYFLDTGDESVRSSRRLHTQRHILPNAWVVFLYISVGREQS